ncbi:MAG: phosphotransferase [Proteobacteria bacterium]|nr:phosphotransferase [Pseudomonadota bacterium]
MTRKQRMLQWVESAIECSDFTVEPASSDASFRSYFRISTAQDSYILMDAPVKYEDCKPFIQVSQILVKADVNVPDLIATNLQDGFLLLEDFGTTLYLDKLNAQNVDQLYAEAIKNLHHMQNLSQTRHLPKYTADLLKQEMQLFNDWFIKKHLGEEITAENQKYLDGLFETLTNNALEQPQVFVHRDYHSRNLMVTENKSPGVIDFQDAVLGPVSYDLVSLLKDCYIKWPEHKITSWVEQFRISFNQHNNSNISQGQWQKWFDLMGVQRHLKAIGIFCRLNYRDNKSQFLADIPRTLNYIIEVADRYTEFNELSYLINRLTPKLTAF